MPPKKQSAAKKVAKSKKVTARKAPTKPGRIKARGKQLAVKQGGQDVRGFFLMGTTNEAIKQLGGALNTMARKS